MQLEIPLTDDHVSKIEHIGRETVRKLADLRVAAMECGLKEVAAALNQKTARIETGTPPAMISVCFCIVCNAISDGQNVLPCR